MSMIRFSAECDPSQLASMIRQSASIVGWTAWQRRIETLKTPQNFNPVWHEFLLERHGLELAFGDIHDHLRNTGRCPWPPRTAEEYRLYSFLAVVLQVHAKLSPRGRKKLSGAIRNGLEREFGLGPVAFEMKIAAHLMSRGFEIHLHDLEGDGGYDFLAQSGEVQFEIECKHVSADIGRQIHRRKLHDLGGVLFPKLLKAVDRGNGGQLVHVTLSDRLTSNRDQQQAIARCVDAILSEESPGVDDGSCSVAIQPFSLEASPFCGDRGGQATMEEIKNYLRSSFDIENANFLLNWRPGRAAVVVWFKSAKPDRVLEEFFKHLKADAKRQFSGNLPAFLCVHLADLNQEQLLDLADTERSGTATGIQRAVSTLLQKRPHLHTVALMVDGDVRLQEQRSGNRAQTSVQESGLTYVFRSSEHPSSGLLKDVFV